MSWGVGTKPSVLIRSRALHVKGLGVFVEYLLPRPPCPPPCLSRRGGRAFRIRGCAAALLVSKGPSMCRSSEDHVPSLGERQGHTRTYRARVSVYSSCPPTSAAVVGAVDLGRSACGLQNSRTPNRSPPLQCHHAVCVNPSSHAPRPVLPALRQFSVVVEALHTPCHHHHQNAAVYMQRGLGGEFRQGKFSRDLTGF